MIVSGTRLRFRGLPGHLNTPVESICTVCHWLTTLKSLPGIPHRTARHSPLPSPCRLALCLKSHPSSKRNCPLNSHLPSGCTVKSPRYRTVKVPVVPRKRERERRENSTRSDNIADAVLALVLRLFNWLRKLSGLYFEDPCSLPMTCKLVAPISTISFKLRVTVDLAGSHSTR